VGLIHRLDVIDIHPLRRGSRSHLRQSKVENLGVSAFGDEDVRRLDVAVNNAFRVGRIERVGDFNRQVHQRVIVHRTGADGMLEREAVQELHRDEGMALVLVDL